MDEKLRSVLDKIAKLRALAAGATTQGEAEAAAGQAAALAAKYQIDEAQIEAASGERAEEIGEGDELWTSETRNEKWRSCLAAALAEDHGCAMIRTSWDGLTIYHIAGRPSDVALVRYLFAWLHVEIARLSERERGRAAKNSFRYGAVVGVLGAMRAARKGETQASAHGQATALAIVSRAEQSMDVFRRQAEAAGRKIATSARASLSDPGALRRGLVAGTGLAPRPGLTGGEGRFMLGGGK